MQIVPLFCLTLLFQESGVSVKLLACEARAQDFEPGSCHLSFRIKIYPAFM